MRCMVEITPVFYGSGRYNEDLQVLIVAEAMYAFARKVPR